MRNRVNRLKGWRQFGEMAENAEEPPKQSEQYMAVGGLADDYPIQHDRWHTNNERRTRRRRRPDRDVFRQDDRRVCGGRIADAATPPGTGKTAK